MPPVKLQGSPDRKNYFYGYKITISIPRNGTIQKYLSFRDGKGGFVDDVKKAKLYREALQLEADLHKKYNTTSRKEYYASPFRNKHSPGKSKIMDIPIKNLNIGLPYQGRYGNVPDWGCENGVFFFNTYPPRVIVSAYMPDKKYSRPVFCKAFKTEKEFVAAMSKAKLVWMQAHPQFAAHFHDVHHFEMDFADVARVALKWHHEYWWANKHKGNKKGKR